MKEERREICPQSKPTPAKEMHRISRKLLSSTLVIVLKVPLFQERSFETEHLGIFTLNVLFEYPGAAVQGKATGLPRWGFDGNSSMAIFSVQSDK